MPNFQLSPLFKAYMNGTFSGVKFDPEATKRFAAENPHPVFSLSAYDLVQNIRGKDTFLYRPLMKHMGGKWKSQYQKSGTCVGQGTKTVADMLEAITCEITGAEFVGRSSVAGMYAGSRVEIAKQPGRWEGSNGVWAAKFVMQYGMLMLKTIGLPEDSLDPDEQLALKWTASREGIPANYEPEAKKFRIKTASLVRTFEEAAAAIENGYPIINCSNLIPTGSRDSNGFSKARRAGGHCTTFGAVRYDIPGLLYINSWSEGWGSGGKYPDDMPPGSVWVSKADANAILGQGDSYAFSDVEGFQRRKLSFKLV